MVSPAKEARGGKAMIIPIITAAVIFMTGTVLGIALTAACYGAQDARAELIHRPCTSSFIEVSQKAR
jgi:hypothetical protein